MPLRCVQVAGRGPARFANSRDQQGGGRDSRDEPDPSAEYGHKQGVGESLLAAYRLLYRPSAPVRTTSQHEGECAAARRNHCLNSGIRGERRRFMNGHCAGQ